MKPHKRSKGAWLAGAIMALLALAFVYLLFQMRAITNPQYRTETAIEYEMLNSISMKAAAAFEWQPVEGEGLMGYLVDSGERVRPSQPVAEVYTDTAQQQARAQWRQMQNRKLLLEESQKIEGSDVGVLSQQQQNSLYLLLDCLDSGRYTAAPNAYDSYLVAANKLQLLTGRAPDFSTALQEVTAQCDALAQAAGQPAVISAPVSGYFVGARDCGIQPYTAQQLKEMTPAQLQRALTEASGEKAGGAGRIITDYHWSLYGTAPWQQASQLKEGQEITLRLPERGGEELPVKVKSVTKSEDGSLAKIELACEYVTPEAVGLGIEDVELIVASYKGIRVSRSAEHTSTEVDEEGKSHEVYGVYVKLGNLMYFRKIGGKLYENEEYMLLPIDGGKDGESEVRLYDEIIVEGTDLHDGKLI